MNLSLLFLVPLATSLVILCWTSQKRIRAIALGGAAIQFALALNFLRMYLDQRALGNTDPMLLVYNTTWFKPLHIQVHLGIDGISLAMILLTALVVLAGVLVSWNMTDRSREYFFLLLFLSVGAYGFFISLDLFTLFFFLEIAVIPKFLLISIWGSGKKEYSAMKLALMLMGGSALVFVGLMGIYFHTESGLAGSGLGNFDLQAISRQHLPIHVQKLFFPFLFVGFGVFGALFPFHTWVPDGHSSAPTAASMFLAGISMKLGGYGCLRVATYLMPDAAQTYSWIIVLAASIAIIYGAFATMMQQDLKYINAYSSVSHCGFVLLGIGMLTRTSIIGAVLQMVSHGLMTALFFATIGMIYSRTHTRMVRQLGGLLKIMPFISTVFVLAGLCSLGLPGLSGFVAEVTVFMGSWQNPDGWYRLATIMACSSIVVTAVYILRAIGQTVMGPVTDLGFRSLTDAGWNERLASAILVIGIVWIGVAPFTLTKLVSPATDIIVEQLPKAISVK
jgi:NADH-quinone oxidoreductase subunit M